MKKNLLSILMLVMIFCVSVYPQKTIYKYLQNTYDSTTAANYDTLTVFNLGRQYEQASLIVENTGAVACTLSVTGGTFVRNSDEWTIKNIAGVTDTNYFVIPINSNAGANTTSFIVGSGATLFYEIKKPYLELLKVYITQNAGGKVKLFLETGESVKK
ncbi:MAG: hypothetical protein RBR74_06720 [Ignavibacteriaceae bacterium]|jgi:hypothetical protein|nr:hypothetical protein [Ignavibacteriaceae bacterium]